jgi:sporulation protein YlmC with PRC-barrel domain
MAKEERRPTGGRDAAGFGPHLREGMRLVPLKELDGYRLADGEPDIRGWPVQTLSGRKIGEVDDVLVDEVTGEVVLLDVDLDGTRRRTLAPARAVQLQREHRVVLIDSIELRDAEQLPTLARTGEVTAQELGIFRDNYAQLYGQRAFHTDRDYDIQRRDQQVRLASHPDADRVPLPDAHDRDRDGRDDRVERVEHAVRHDEHRAAHRHDADRTVESTSLGSRDVRFPRANASPATPTTPGGTEEVVVERRPVVMEEVVVRRRVVDPNEATDAMDAQRLRDRAADDERRTP